MSTTLDRKFEPTDVSPDILRQIDQTLHERKATLIGEDGERVELPQSFNDLFHYIVGCMRWKQSIFLMSEDETMTTQAAARVIGVSRPYLVRLLDEGKIPFHRVGSHRRVTVRYLAAYQETRNKERRGNIERVVRADRGCRPV